MDKKAAVSSTHGEGANRSVFSRFGYSHLSRSCLLFFAVIPLLLCFLYFDILSFSPTGGFILNLSAIQTFSRPTSVGRRYRQPSISQPLSSSQSVDFTLKLSGSQSIVDSSQLASPEIVRELAPSSLDLSAEANTSLDSESDRTIVGSIPASADSDGKSTKKESMEVPKQNSITIQEVVEEDAIHKRPRKKEGHCDWYDGKWIKDDSYPLYHSEECPFIDQGFRCQENGRPDQDYLKWRWQPFGCNMPSFNSDRMLNMLRGRRLVFVGDSIGRNQWESMLCLLATAVKNKTSIREVNGEPITKHKGFLIFKFESYNCTVEYYRSPFLVPQGSPPRNSPKDVLCSLKVDKMDWTSKRWLGADVIVFNTGHWWSDGKIFKGNCFFEVGNKVNKSMGLREGFAKSMQTWRKWVAANIDPSKTRVFFRTYAPAHFIGGTWKTGGTCDNETEPYEERTKFEREFWTNGPLLKQIEALSEKVHLLDITKLSSFRKDAHSSIYYVESNQPRPFRRQDCSHWCLPGLPDTWNHLLYATLISAPFSSPQSL